MNAEVEKIVVRVFSEVRFEIKDVNYPEGTRVEYGYKHEGSYVPKNETEALTIEGIAKMITFHNSDDVHPFIGKPFYIALLYKGKLSGRVIKCFKGHGSGFYLIQGLEIDEDGSLIRNSGEKTMSPLSSKPFNMFFQNIIAEVEHEKK
jgi:hypothetical protein